MSILPTNDYVPERKNKLDIKPGLKPPAYGEPQRDAIASVVDGIVTDLCAKIHELRAMLDSLEQRTITSAANSKGSLNDHVKRCGRLNDQLAAMRAVVEELGDDIRQDRHGD
jgi:hypothetical protein